MARCPFWTRRPLRMTIAFSASNHAAGFVRTDLQILGGMGEIELLPEGHLPFVWRKVSPVARASLVYGWFADLPNLDTGILCRVLRKPFVLAVGGYELANYPEFGYGLQRRLGMRLVVRKCFDYATALLFLHRGLLEEASRFHPDARDKMRVVPAGYDGSFWRSQDGVHRKYVATVIAADSMSRFMIKGGPHVLEVARRFPDHEFVIVGLWPEVQRRLRSQPPPNVRMIPRIPADQVRRVLQESTVYLQFSLREVFPNAVCEAMLCGSIPVVSPLPAMREVVGDAGFVANASDVASYATALEEALGQAELLRDQARQRILTAYPLEKRSSELRSMLSHLST